MQQKEQSFQVAPEEHIPSPAKDDLLFLPLGGSGEVGMNVNLYGTNKQWIMVDLGISFGEDHKGLSFVTANLDIMLKSNLHKSLKGVVITHGHEDHIGAVHTVWPYFKFHIYCSKFAREIIINKLEECSYRQEVIDFYLHEIPPTGNIKLGDFDIQYMGITHSIPESNALLIKTPQGTIFHTGDWKLDPGPVIGDPINPKMYQKLADEHVDFMVCDSTNIMVPGRAGSEEDLIPTFEKLFTNKRMKNHRILVTCFASNLARLKTIGDIGRSLGRKVCLLGRSIHRMTEAADRCKFPIHLDQFIEEDKALRLKPHEVMYICTGSQGDENAAIARIARGVHRIKLDAGDTVLFSSKIIPGNERKIGIVMNNLVRLGCHIITEKDAHIHVSGHPCRDEISDMYKWVKPACVVPVHGEMLHLVTHARFAKKHQIETLIPENGHLISLKKKKVLKRYAVGRWGYDGNHFINVDSATIKERSHIGCEGCVLVTLQVNKDNHMKDVMISFVGLLEDNVEKFKQTIRDGIRNVLESKESNGKPLRFQTESLRTYRVIDRVRTLCLSSLKKNPHVKIHWIYSKQV